MRGTRVSGERAQASEFAWVIPVEFDQALGIRTVQRDEAAPAYTRAVSGIAEAGRDLMAKLAKKASRKVRRPHSKAPVKAPAGRARTGAEQPVVTAVSDEVRCTPMQVGASAGSSAGTTSLPPESKLASGISTSPTPKKSSGKAGGRRKLNAVGRRFQLAKELTQELDWLRGCSVPRIAWVARGVAGAETILDTPAKRAGAVEQWRGAQEAARRHRIPQVRARTERNEGEWDAPASQAVRRQVNEAFAAAFGPAAAPEAEAAFGQVGGAANGGRGRDQNDVADDQGLEAEPIEQELAQLRAVAWAELMAGGTSFVMTAVASMGQFAAERVYGAELVQRARQIASGSRSSWMTYGRR